MRLLLVISTLILVGNIGGHNTSRAKDATQEYLPKSLYDDMSRQIAHFSNQAGLINLRSKSLSNSTTEIRIWKGGGLLYPRCFILKFQKRSRDAYLVAPKVVNNRAVYRSQNQVIYLQTLMENPRSGWESVVEYLNSKGLDDPIGLTLDKTFEPDPDQEAIYLEVRSGRRYTMVFYLDSTKSQDGKKVFDVCHKIENEFAKRIGCGN